mgnify:CR=1 FL=1
MYDSKMSEKEKYAQRVLDSSCAICGRMPMYPSCPWPGTRIGRPSG